MSAEEMLWVWDSLNESSGPEPQAPVFNLAVWLVFLAIFIAAIIPTLIAFLIS